MQLQIREWVIFGLPNDSFSIDSAVIAATSRRWPLCIDPQGQANRWIKAMHEAQKIKVRQGSRDGRSMLSCFYEPSTGTALMCHAARPPHGIISMPLSCLRLRVCVVRLASWVAGAEAV